MSLFFSPEEAVLAPGDGGGHFHRLVKEVLVRPFCRDGCFTFRLIQFSFFADFEGIHFLSSIIIFLFLLSRWPCLPRTPGEQHWWRRR